VGPAERVSIRAILEVYVIDRVWLVAITSIAVAGPLSLLGRLTVTSAIAPPAAGAPV
jgi:hypothetical protein